MSILNKVESLFIWQSNKYYLRVAIDFCIDKHQGETSKQ